MEYETPYIKGIFTEDTILEAVKTALDDLDADDFAVIVGELLGGTCYFITATGLYSFESNENYSGALGSWVQE